MKEIMNELVIFRREFGIDKMLVIKFKQELWISIEKVMSQNKNNEKSLWLNSDGIKIVDCESSGIT